MEFESLKSTEVDEYGTSASSSLAFGTIKIKPSTEDILAMLKGTLASWELLPNRSFECPKVLCDGPCSVVHGIR